MVIQKWIILLFPLVFKVIIADENSLWGHLKKEPVAMDDKRELSIGIFCGIRVSQTMHTQYRISSRVDTIIP